MPNCAICKKSVTTGIVLCGHCAKGLAPYTLPADLAWFIDQLSEEIVLNHDIYACSMCAMPAFSYQGRAAAVNCSGVMRRMYSAIIQRSLLMSKMAGL